MTPDLAAFDRHRRLLFTVAYQMLGSVADAEDVVQDTWLRWSAAARDDVTDAMVAGLRGRLDDAALVELTMMVAVENTRSRFNAALGLTSQGFRDRCEIPAR